MFSQENGNHAKKKIISSPIVAKKFVKKNGKTTDYEEHYLRLSLQDYFIKFCESIVTKKELEKALNKDRNEIKTLTLEVEFRNGELDICDDAHEQQSRIGNYVIIHQIIDK